MSTPVYSFCNQKGGVGKTTSVINLSAHIAKQGYRVLVVDMDPQANATSGLGLQKPGDESTAYQLLVDNSEPAGLISNTAFDNLFIIPANAHLAGAELELVSKIGREFALKNQLTKIRDQFDYVFIDCPPSLGLITVNCLNSSNYIIIPLQCEYYAMEGLAQLLNVYDLIHRNLNKSLEIAGVILTMADFRTNLTQQVIEEIRGYFKEKVFKSVVPRSVKLSEAPSFGKPAIFYDPHNKGSKSYQAIGQEFLERFPCRRPEEAAAASAQESPAGSGEAEIEKAPQQVQGVVNDAPAAHASASKLEEQSATERGDTQ